MFSQIANENDLCETNDDGDDFIVIWWSGMWMGGMKCDRWELTRMAKFNVELQMKMKVNEAIA